MVSRLSQYLAKPTEEQWVTVKHVLRYPKGTTDKGLTFRRNTTENPGVQAYSDADWAADTRDRRSTTGYCVSLSDNSALVFGRLGNNLPLHSLYARQNIWHSLLLFKSAFT